MPIRVIQAAPQDPKPVGVGEDMLRAIPGGALEGVAGLAGSVGDVRELGEGAAGWIADKVGLHSKPDKLRTPLVTALLAGAAKKIGERAGLTPEAATLVSAGVPGGMMGAPSSREILAATDSAGAKRYQPQTTAGKYVRTGAQFAPALAMPGGVVRRIANAVIPAVASETAGQVTAGTKAEPYARVAAALVGAGGVGLAGRGGPDTRLLAEASRGASDAQVAQAQALMRQGQQSGVRLTLAEALQQVTNGATGMGRMQRVVEGTEAGNRRIAPVMAERPAQVSGAVGQFADHIAPPPGNPYMAAQGAREAAGGVMNDVRQAVNANARPFYDALATERMPTGSPAYQELVGNPAYQEALQQVRGNPLLNSDIAHLPNDSLAVMNEVQKQLGTLAENARPNPASATGNAQISAAYDTAARQLDELASASSEPWRLSRAMVASGREAFLEPLQTGPMGAISKTSSPVGQSGALFPNNPPEGAAPITGQTLEMLPDDVSRGLVRQHVMGSFNEAAQQNIPGENQWGGAKWAAQVAGNPEQQRVLQTGVEAVGGNRGDLDSLVEVLRATGRRERPGSLTAYNSRAIEELGNAGAMGEAMRTGLNPPGVFRRVGQAFQNWQTENNAGRLADAILADPDAAGEILMRARRVVPPGAELDAIERAALATQLARQHQLEQR